MIFTLRLLRYPLLLLGLLLVVSCQEKKPLVVKPKQKPLTPIERYLREHFDKPLKKSRKRAYFSQKEPHHVIDSLVLKSIQATVYRISQSACATNHCNREFVIRNNLSGAFFRFYQRVQYPLVTRHPELVIGSGWTNLKPLNRELLGLEAFINERDAFTPMPVLMASLDSLIRYVDDSANHLHRIRTVASLDSILHYPKVKKLYPVRSMLVKKISTPGLLLYGIGWGTESVAFQYYQFVGQLEDGETGVPRYQYELVHLVIVLPEVPEA